ncbi:hypothetical protein SAMN02745166_01543 [Prosthecobacter debontii]|uniref:TonB family C-terminal domain-containing protein n=1 Tax=Prosthecobacter debontii TaxID=48467 RepID=A0A1T4XHW6_9BACT|nr:energy transducer TonB [Prosthecobacter debontii]SKA89139.1 hypothetical protein SAMN02745166_01543 [Prosthecobacter debontii]
MHPSLQFCSFLTVFLGIASCSAPTPKRQAFPLLDRTVQAHVKAGDQVLYPQLVYSPKPEYPVLPASGSVWAVMRVDRSGQVSEIKVIGTAPKTYVASIERALSQWKFKPGSIAGCPTEFPMQVKISFAESANPEAVNAAKSQQGLIFDFRHWLIRSSFPELIDEIEMKERRGEKLVRPKLAKAPSNIKHPDPTKTGIVFTTFIINAKGRPENIHIFGDVPAEFRETISNAILSGEYKPATLNGKPHACPTGMPFKFITHGYSDE